MHIVSSFPLGYQRFLLVATSCQRNLASWQLGKMHFITWLPLLTTMALALDRFWIFGHLTSTPNWFVALCLGVLVLVLTLLVFFTSNTSEAFNSRDYCEVNSERCDEHGTYKYHGVTSFEDFNIKDQLDDDFELIKLRPKLALKRTEKTLTENPKR